MSMTVHEPIFVPIQFGLAFQRRLSALGSGIHT